MDFTLALTHFCEAHGPKSVLCTQVLPLECDLCLPPSPSLRASSSTDSLTTQVHQASLESGHELATPPPALRKTDTNGTLPTDFSGASTTVDSEAERDSLKIETHPLFQAVDQKQDLRSQWRYGRSQGETCASCSFSVPKNVAEKLPAGAPGSLAADGSTANTGAPVLRSREFVCLGQRRRSRHRHSSKPASYGSSLNSSHSHSTHVTAPSSAHAEDCHDHTLTYLTAKSPNDPEGYAQLRASVIRTLSCELLPRGVSDGPFCFGDATAGYTIAYIFRLTDPRARGRRRAYAFVALAGTDANRAFQACPMLWEAFANMAKGIENAAQRHQERQRRKEAKEADASAAAKPGARNYTPVSSFLTARTVDPDGHPRRVGQASPRGLAEIVGDENIFTFLHQYFVTVLRCLGDQFGGVPLAEKTSVYQSVSQDSPSHSKTSVVPDGTPGTYLDPHQMDSLRDEDTTPKPSLYSTAQTPTWPQTTTSTAPHRAAADPDDLHVAKSRANKAFQLNPQCAPLAVNETAQRQVVV